LPASSQDIATISHSSRAAAPSSTRSPIESRRPAGLAIVDLNIRAVVEITLCFLPAIRAARGKILNVASVAAYFPGGPGAAYYASKSFVLSFSLALSQELQSQGVTVSALCPGYTKTDFQARAGKFENHAHMVAIYAVWYNWVRIHKTLRVTPAMAAGLSKTVMDWTDVVEAMDADAPATKRGHYKKTGEQISN
jgi:short-subunit dehydrogenase